MSQSWKLYGASTRATNLVSTAAAEVLTAGNGWLLGTNVTPAAGSLVGPLGFGTSTNVVIGGAGTNFMRLVAGTFGAVKTTFSVFISPGTMTQFSLNLRDNTALVAYSAVFTLSGGVWTAGSFNNGAIGRVYTEQYDNGWIRFSVEFTIDGSTATVAGNAIRVEITPISNSVSFDVWGVLLEQVNQFDLASGYLTGMGGQDGPRAVPIVRPQRVKDEQGYFEILATGTPSFTIKLQGRPEPGAAWYTILTWDNTNLTVDTTFAATVSIFPEMRAVITAIDTATTVSAWLIE